MPGPTSYLAIRWKLEKLPWKSRNIHKSIFNVYLTIQQPSKNTVVNQDLIN